MIKINLLPVPKARKAKKAAEVRSEFVLAGVLVGVVVIACGYFWYLQNAKINHLQAQKDEAGKELVSLKAKVKEVENYEINKKDLEAKNKIIEQLKRNQGAPVHLLDEISRSVDPLKIWLNTISAQGSKLDIEGRAITNADIVEFINNMKKSNFFSDIQLIESRQSQDVNVPIYNFKLHCTLVI